jgi:DNA-binding transcriptional ArsR family regulator
LVDDDKNPDPSVKPEEYIEVISTEDERIKIIGEELANDTGRAIFGKISQGVTTSSELSKALEISLPLVNWHINRLLGVGLIKVEKVEMSQKNKQMKYYAPVKTALVIIPPENPSAKNTKETILMKLRHYMAAIVSFAVGASGIYIAEESQSQQVLSPVQETAPAGPSMLHAAIKAAPLVSQASQPESTTSSGEPVMILLALLGGGAIFCAVFFGLKLAKRTKNKKSKQTTS